MLVLNNLILGIGVGIVIGAGIGTAIEAQNSENSTNDDPFEATEV